MALIIANRVREASNTTGTGPFTLSGTAVGYQTFSAGIGEGNTTYYAIASAAGEWEVGLGTITSGQLVRTTVLDSSNSGELVDFVPGVKDVFTTVPASEVMLADREQTLTNKTLTYEDNTLIGVQPTLVSGTNLKTVNSSSLLGSGNLAVGDVTLAGAQTLTNKTLTYADNTLTGVQPTLVSGTSLKTVNSSSLLGSGNLAVGDVTLTGAQTLTNKTLTNPVIDGGASGTTAGKVGYASGAVTYGTGIAQRTLATVEDLANPAQGAEMVAFRQAGAGAVDRKSSDKLREFVSVKDFGAIGDGVTDDTAAIQAAITASKGKRLLFPAGRYLTSSTLTVPHPMILIGEGSALNDGDGTGASTILFSGTGPALQFGGAGYAIFYPNLQNLRIQATGAAITDANAIGLYLVNIHGGKFYDLAVRSFQAGTGVLCTATAGQISAGNTFWGPNLWQNFVGFKFDGAGAANPFAADYASYIFGGAVIGVDDGGLGIAGSRGLWVTQWAAETQVYATDFETFDVCIDLYGDHPNTGGGVKLVGTRTEFQRTRAIRINANTSRTQIIGHRFAGGAASTWMQDNGVRTMRLDPDGNIRTNTADLELLNDIPVKLQDSGGTARTVMKMATNNTVQIGSVNYSGFNGNYGMGTWNFTAPVFENAGGASGWQNAVRFGAYRLWVDSTGKLRIKSSAPTSDTDGTIVGTQT